MNISQIILMLMHCANTLEREVVCNDDFDGNDDVTDAIEDIRNVAKTLKTFIGADSKTKAKREEFARAIEAVLNNNVSNKEFQFFFGYTTSEEDAIHCFGQSDYCFDANIAAELTTRAARHMAIPKEFADHLMNCIWGESDDD